MTPCGVARNLNTLLQNSHMPKMGWEPLLQTITNTPVMQCWSTTLHRSTNDFVPCPKQARHLRPSPAAVSGEFPHCAWRAGSNPTHPEPAGPSDPNLQSAPQDTLSQKREFRCKYWQLHRVQIQRPASYKCGYVNYLLLFFPGESSHTHTTVFQLLPVQRCRGFPLLPQLVHGQQVHDVIFEKLDKKHNQKLKSRFRWWRITHTTHHSFTLIKDHYNSLKCSSFLPCWTVWRRHIL